MGARVLSHEDDDVAGEVRSMRVDEGVDVLEDAAPVSVCDRSGDKVSVVLRTPDGERTVDGTDLLVATGRTPNTAGIGLEAAGVRLDAGGYLAVDERLETSAPNVWGSANAVRRIHSSLMRRSTTSASFATTWQAETAPDSTGWCHTACSRILNWPGSG
jgi:thioredoxin reductase